MPWRFMRPALAARTLIEINACFDEALAQHDGAVIFEWLRWALGLLVEASGLNLIVVWKVIPQCLEARHAETPHS